MDDYLPTTSLAKKFADKNKSIWLLDYYIYNYISSSIQLMYEECLKTESLGQKSLLSIIMWSSIY